MKTEGSSSRKRYVREILHLNHEEKNVIHHPDGTKVKYPHSNPLLITARICGWDTNPVYIDIGSNTNMIFKKLLNKLKVSLSQVRHNSGSTFDARRDTIPTLGVATLPLMLIRTTAHKTLDCLSVMAKFLVLDLSSSFKCHHWPTQSTGVQPVLQRSLPHHYF